jgi:hypothetical protein
LETTAGDVGIKKTPDSGYALDVSGNVKFTGTIYAGLTNSSGSYYKHQVLK